MRSAMCLAMTVLVLFVGPAPADAGPDPGANAALKYWQAFATLPGFKAAEQAKLTAECLTRPLDAQARGSVTSAKYALDKFAANPMYKRFVPGILRCRWQKAQPDVRLALLSAAVAVQLDFASSVAVTAAAMRVLPIDGRRRGGGVFASAQDTQCTVPQQTAGPPGAPLIYRFMFPTITKAE